MVRWMSAEFEVARNSVRSYCDAPRFVVDYGIVRLRGDDEPFTYTQRKANVRVAQGVFRLGSRRVAVLYNVNADLLRGCGRRLPNAAGAILGVYPGDKTPYFEKGGGSLVLSFPWLSFSGPVLSAPRQMAIEAGAKEGDALTVILDANTQSVVARVTSTSPGAQRGWPLVARMTGIDLASEREGLAKAMGCEQREIEATLIARREYRVLGAIPPRRTHRRPGYSDLRLGSR